MERIQISDNTLKQDSRALSLSFREKIELCKLIDRLNVDFIELPPIRQKKVDSLLIKSIATVVRQSRIAVQVDLNPESVHETWNALKEASAPRLQVMAPVSSVQIEYLCHMKPAALQQAVVDTIQACRLLTDDVEFIADDYSRGDPEFVLQLLQAALDAGATHLTFREIAGVMLPEELRVMLEQTIADLRSSEGVVLGVDCSNGLSMADSCAVEAIRSGIREIKAASYRADCVSLPHLVQILSLKGEQFGVSCAVRREELKRITSKIRVLFRSEAGMEPMASADTAQADDETMLSVHDSRDSILKAISALGYELSAEDNEKVYNAFLSVAQKKERVTLRELEAMIAAEAMQVPAVISVESYTITTGSATGAMAHMKLKMHDRLLDGVAAGDGPIDAAFLAIEHATGRHFELDGFQIQAMTAGRDSTGETMIRLRSEGKIYSGRGLSTDIVGAGIQSYINALNKIMYEEEEA